MIENRELSLDDYLAMLRRRLQGILIPTLLGLFVGLVASFLFAPRFTATATILVEPPAAAEDSTAPALSEDVSRRIAVIREQVLSRNQLEPMIERLNLVEKGRSLDQAVDQIRQSLQVQPARPSASGTSKKKNEDAEAISGFDVSYTAYAASEAQRICNEIASRMVAESLNERGESALGPAESMDQQLEAAKRGLEKQDAELASFKKQYIGQLHGDQDDNLKTLAGLNSQMDSNTLTLHLAEQDKSDAESLLAQQLAAWKASSSEAADGGATGKTGEAEPAEIQQLRGQIRQYRQAGAQAAKEQKHIQEQINLYQNRIALVPTLQERYKVLLRNYDSAQRSYKDLLAKKNGSAMEDNRDRVPKGEQMRRLNPASLPKSPSFPSRLRFAGGGAAAGLAIGFAIALGLEVKDKSLRTEEDVVSALGLPMLVAVPWVGANASRGGDYGKSVPAAMQPNSQHETTEIVEV
jgi:uncharacterized protein involved in exopolysaccharide biosynthesis